MILKNRIYWRTKPPWLFLKCIRQHFGHKIFPKFWTQVRIMTSSVTWPNFRNVKKIFFGISIIYRWKEEEQGFSTSTKPTSYLKPFMSYANFSIQPIRWLHFSNWWRQQKNGRTPIIFVYMDTSCFEVDMYKVSSFHYLIQQSYRGGPTSPPRVWGLQKSPGPVGLRAMWSGRVI